METAPPVSPPAAPQTAPYGTWKSPITADLIVAGSVGLGQVSLDRSILITDTPQDGASPTASKISSFSEDLYWLESRPSEKGRNVLVRARSDHNGELVDVTPAPFNVRTRAHEYGGGAYLVHSGAIYFVHFADQRVYVQTDAAAAPRALTPAIPYRYADFEMDEARGRLICIIEDHETKVNGQEENCIGSIDLATGQVQKWVRGYDFFSTPRLSPNGAQLCWLAWNHPNMPWDGTDLWVADVADDGSLVNSQRIAGGVEESIFQPEWAPNGDLLFVSDRSNWWNLYRLRAGQLQEAAEALYPLEAEFGLPQWNFTTRTYDFIDQDTLFCAYFQTGFTYFGLLDLNTKRWAPLDLPYTALSRAGLRAGNGKAIFGAASATQGNTVVVFDLLTGQHTTLKRASTIDIDTGYISIPQAIEYPTENGLTAHAFYYPPQNKDFVAPEGELPPLLVESHGGPTAATQAVFSLGTQYWTSRGIGMLDVNYGGSTGYGREYRKRLNGTWGITDVDDCVNGAKYLVKRGLADENRLMITGGSAGGYTTLCALTFRDVFKAGASHFGVSDAEALAKDTHKFESRYLDNLIGAYPAQKDIYIERSPIHFADRISAPLILLQGLEDPVVPPDQSERMFIAVRNKEIPTAYVTFEGEQHGFRQAQNIKRALEVELYFYSRVFDFPLADPIEPVTIENLD